jgi:glucokinase
MRYSIGVDLGGTKINIALIDGSGQILNIKRISTRIENGPDAIQNEIIKVIKSILLDYSPIGVGVGIAGQVDSNNGLVYFAPNLRWNNVPLQAYLSQALNLPIAVTGDVRAATLAEWRCGAGKNCRNFVCLFIGTGIGSGIVAEGYLIEGSSNTAGEIGHTIIDINGSQCTCGNWGCLETISSGWAIAQKAQEALKNDSSQGQILLDKCENHLNKITAKMVIEASKENNPLSQLIVSNAIKGIVIGCVNIINCLNPERIIISGGIKEGLPNLLLDIENGIKNRALAAAQSKLQILPAYLKQDAGVIGAGLLVFDKIS